MQAEVWDRAWGRVEWPAHPWGQQELLDEVERLAEPVGWDDDENIRWRCEDAGYQVTYTPRKEVY